MKKISIFLVLLTLFCVMSVSAALAAGDKNHGDEGSGYVNQDWKCVQLDECPLTPEPEE